MSRRTTGIAILALFISTVAYPCGESLYRVGKGVAYREFIAPLPGNLLIYANTPDAEHFAEALRKSGHTVSYTDSLNDFEARAATGDFDVIIAPFTASGHYRAVSSGIKSAFLPVASNKDDERVARREFGGAMRSDKHEVRHYLKAIHIALKQQR